jgi:hypothetical protein
VKLWGVGDADAPAAEGNAGGGVALAEELPLRILGAWIVVQTSQGAPTREPHAPDYDFVFYEDGTLGSFEVRTPFASTDGTPIEDPVSEYIPIEGTYEFIDSTELRIVDNPDNSSNDMTVQVSISGDRMTWTMDGMEVELQRVGPAE